MKLLDKAAEKYIDAEIAEVISNDFLSIAKDNRFSFNWDTEKGYKVYKIFLTENEGQILGLVSLIDIPQEYRVHLNLLEVSIENQGSEKSIDFIAGCLIAIAAEFSFKKGYYGFVSLMPKTQLIELYQKKYGFKQYGRYLGIEGLSAQKIIEKYIDNE